MRILLATGFPHLPQIYGGVMSNTHELALELKRRGHQPFVAADLVPIGLLGLRTRVIGKLVGKRKVNDRFLGYPVYRRWGLQDAIPDLVALTRPYAAIIQPSHQISLGQTLIRLGVPVVVYFHDVLFDRLDGDPRTLDSALFLANSEFTARRCGEEYGIDCTVIPPVFRAAFYRSRSTRRNVTFINPQPFKGSDIALKLVTRCPEIPFCFVESWELPEKEKHRLRALARTLPNLILKGPTMNMKAIYRRAKVLLAPSLVDEAWGRIASEAHFSGIPVLASNRGGLPESVGPGGVVLDPDSPIEAWVQALRRLWTDHAYYQTLSNAAFSYSTRPDLDPGTQIRTLLNVVERAVRAADKCEVRTSTYNTVQGIPIDVDG